MFKRWLIAATAIALLSCNSAFASSWNFVFNGTDALGDTIDFTYHSEVMAGAFTVFEFLNNATCSVSNSLPCGLIEFGTGDFVQPNLGIPAGLADQIRVTYGSQLDNVFWFPLLALDNDGTYSTIAASPGAGTLTRTFDPGGTPDGGLNPPDQAPVPEPATALLLLGALPIMGLIPKRAFS